MSLAITFKYWFVLRERHKKAPWFTLRMRLTDPSLTRATIDSAWPSEVKANSRRDMLNDPWNE